MSTSCSLGEGEGRGLGINCPLCFFQTFSVGGSFLTNWDNDFIFLLTYPILIYLYRRILKISLPCSVRVFQHYFYLFDLSQEYLERGGALKKQEKKRGWRSVSSVRSWYKKMNICLTWNNMSWNKLVGKELHRLKNHPRRTEPCQAKWEPHGWKKGL